MDDTSLRVLLVEDNPEDAFLLGELLRLTEAESFELMQVEDLEQALGWLRQELFDVVLLDLSLPDSQGLEALARVCREAPGVPVLVLTGLDDCQLSARAIRYGAQDYLTKGKLTSEMLERAIRHAIERHRLLADVSATALFDELTGLYNRRGLHRVGGPLCKSVGRMKKGMTLLFLDLDNLKQINDSLGHEAGDQTLVETAEVLRQTFRESDIVARVGGDEFAVLAMGVTASSSERLAGRLHERLREHNAQVRHPWPLSLSVGRAYNDPERPSSLEALLAQADDLMYQQKRAKRTGQLPQIALPAATPV